MIPFEQFTTIVRPDSGDHIWKGQAIRLCPDPEEPWHVFVTCDDTGLWLSPMEVEHPSPAMSLPDAEKVAKLVALYGATWDDIWEDPMGVIALQHRALDALDEGEWARINATPMDELLDWRHVQITATDGERLREQITGVEIEAGRN